MSSAKKTTDHDEILRWVEERKGRPSIVRATSGPDHASGLLRIDFGDRDEALQEIEWDQFFAIFDEQELALLHQDRTADGKLSRFSKFVLRASDAADEEAD